MDSAPRFSLRSLMIGMLVAAVLATVVRVSGWLFGLMAVHAFLPLLLWCALKTIRWRNDEDRQAWFRRGLLALFVFLPVAAVFWPPSTAWAIFGFHLSVAIYIWTVQYLVLVTVLETS